MGLPYAPLKLTNRLRGDSVSVNALVDTGAMFLCVPESVAGQLGFDAREVRRRLVTLADGRTIEVPVIDPVLIQFENRTYSTEAMVLGDEPPLLGAIPMEAMDVVIEPKTQKMIVNPAHPNYAVSLVKDAR
ncbi:MAG: clan AA aspartic protease [Panacagrimonas sp.]